MKAKGKMPHPGPVAMLLNQKLPIDHRIEMLRSVIGYESKESYELMAHLLDVAASGNVAGYTQKSMELQEMIDEIEQGPKRMATFIGLQELSQSSIQHAVVRLEDGVTAFPIFLDRHTAGQLKCGQNVMLDAHAQILIGPVDLRNDSGEEAHFERLLDPNHIEVSLRGDEHHVFTAADDLMHTIENSEVSSGKRVLVCPRRRMAFSFLPDPDGFSNFRYLDRSKVPDVLINRDMAAPPPFIQEIIQMVRLEMTSPEIRRQYGLQRCVMKLLTGMPGTGKSFAVYGLIREVYEVISGATGLPLTDLPPRVMRLKASTVLSEWLGKSEKNIARFFQEIEQLASQPIVSAEGKAVKLPVIVVLEEIDGLARHRGQEPIMDRIFTTLLELFDPTRRQIKDNFIIFLGTTNKPHLIDSGFLRRIGGTIERFSTLSRNTFAAVLHKHLAGKPLVRENDLDYPQRLANLVNEIASWLFSPNGEDHGQVSLFFVGGNSPEIRFRRDFLNPGLVERAVQQAAQLACGAETAGCENPGLSSAGLKVALDEQIQAIVNVLSRDNIGNYLELPEGARLQSVRAIRQSAMLQAELMRAA